MHKSAADKNWWGNLTKAGQARQDIRLELLRSYLPHHGCLNMLELGCAWGDFTNRLVKLDNAKLVFIDYSLERVKRVASEQKGFSHCVHGLACDMHKLPFKNNSFDVVVGNAILHHGVVLQALEESARVLKKGGIVFFAEPNLWNPQAYLENNIMILRKWIGYEPGEKPLTLPQIRNAMFHAGLKLVTLRHFDFLHPLIPFRCVKAFRRISSILEEIPGIQKFSGSLLCVGKKTRD
ncbi:MAG: class I SAM-dependent methyltransferase [Candidatus Omnitrophica bacterium]|nr:class I SAM-dependent methyltransferase [Candidatus Omnitrophota bacterium]